MIHVPNKDDIVTDLRRCILSSYSARGFEDNNVKTFLHKAETTLEILKDQLRKSHYLLIKQRLEKAKNPKNVLEKRREDLLAASCFL